MGYYLLGYSPQEGTFETDVKRAKFHKVTVRVKRPGAIVRSKSGFSGITDNDASPTAPEATQTREQQLLEALASPFAASDLGVCLTCFYNDFGVHGPIGRSMFHFQAKDLSFAKQLDNSWHASVDIVATAYRGINQSVQRRQRREEIRLPDELYQKALKEGFLYTWDYPMKEPGTFLMRAVVRDAKTARIGSASQAVTVPDTRKGQFAMSGVLVKLATPELTSQTDTAAVGAAGKAESWSEGGPAIRRYLQGQQILYTFLVVNPKLKGAEKKSQVIKEVLVYKDGKLLFRGDPTPINKQGLLDDRRLVGRGILKLGANSPPGEYILQVVVTNQLARKNKSKLTQWIDFEVVKKLTPIVALHTASEGH